MKATLKRRGMRLAALALLLPLWTLALPAQAQILIGQTAGFSGQASAGVKDITDGAKLYLDAVNASGGVHGERIELISMDDRFDPPLAAQNARALIVEKNVQALFLTRGTPHTQAILPLLAQYRVPLVAPSTGAMVFHNPVNPWVFNVRPTYQREAERAIQHLAMIGIERIGVIHVDDSFGRDGLEGAKRGLAAVKKQAVFIEKYQRENWNFATIASLVVSADTQAVLLIGTGKAAIDAIAAIRATGSQAQIITNSNNASSGFIADLKDNARGIVITQVFPNERTLAAPIVKEAHDLAIAKGLKGVTPAMLEGFASAKVLVAGLRRAGPKPTRLKIQRALDDLGKFDLGGLSLNYTPERHSGLDFVDMAIVDANGRFVR